LRIRGDRNTGKMQIEVPARAVVAPDTCAFGVLDRKVERS
jgi:hypothetical protein